MNQKSGDKYILRWLYAGAILVATMVIVGGITRLTQSGLSMVDWNLFMGAIPPSNEGEWQAIFEDYQLYPEFQLKNSTMSLSEFKGIFFWEYFHRLLGRLIGLVFIFPFIVFLLKKMLSPKLLKQSLVLLFLGSLQGFFGWYMVKSGLVDMPSVSHFRLALHLCTAFTTYAYILWVIYGIKHPQKSYRNIGNLSNWVKSLMAVLGIQIIYGAFVAGLDAGLLYPTWPKMGQHWIALEVGSSISTLGLKSMISNPAFVQFIHRWIALVVVVLIIVIWKKSRNLHLNLKMVNGINALLFVVLFQFLVGVLTLIYQVPIFLGVLHQFGALMLLTASIYTLYHFRK